MDRSSSKKAPLINILMLTIAALVTGTIGALAMKEQGLQTINLKPFVHPVFQAFEVFLGQCLLLIVFYGLAKFSASFNDEVTAKKDEAMKASSLAEPNFFLPMIPAFVDLINLVLQFTTILAVLPSIFLMLRCVAPLVNAIFSAIFLKTRLGIQHKLGIIFALAGATMVCVIQIVVEGKDSQPSILGLTFALLSLLTTAIQHVIEQKITKSYYYHPFQLAGFEGVWGLIFATIALAITNFIPCPIDSPFCSFGHFEDVSDIFSFLGGNIWALLIMLLVLTNIIVSNFLSKPVSKSMPLVLQTSIGFMVIVLAWFYAVYRLGESFHGLHLSAFFLIILGHFVYQKIVVIIIPGMTTRRKSINGKNNESTPLLNQTTSLYSDA